MSIGSIRSILSTQAVTRTKGFYSSSFKEPKQCLYPTIPAIESMHYIIRPTRTYFVFSRTNEFYISLSDFMGIYKRINEFYTVL